MYMGTTDNFGDSIEEARIETATDAQELKQTVAQSQIQEYVKSIKQLSYTPIDEEALGNRLHQLADSLQISDVNKLIDIVRIRRDMATKGNDEIYTHLEADEYIIALMFKGISFVDPRTKEVTLGKINEHDGLATDGISTRLRVNTRQSLERTREPELTQMYWETLSDIQNQIITEARTKNNERNFTMPYFLEVLLCMNPDILTDNSYLYITEEPPFDSIEFIGEAETLHVKWIDEGNNRMRFEMFISPNEVVEAPKVSTEPEISTVAESESITATKKGRKGKKSYQVGLEG